jgi:hypothetical protein
MATIDATKITARIDGVTHRAWISTDHDGRGKYRAYCHICDWRINGQRTITGIAQQFHTAHDNA